MSERYRKPGGRRSINVNLTPDEVYELRKILLDERQTMAKFFADYAREYIKRRRGKLHKTDAT